MKKNIRTLFFLLNINDSEMKFSILFYLTITLCYELVYLF